MRPASVDMASYPKEKCVPVCMHNFVCDREWSLDTPCIHREPVCIPHWRTMQCILWHVMASSLNVRLAVLKMETGSCAAVTCWFLVSHNLLVISLRDTAMSRDWMAIWSTVITYGHPGYLDVRFGGRFGGHRVSACPSWCGCGHNGVF